MFSYKDCYDILLVPDKKKSQFCLSQREVGLLEMRILV